MISLDVTSERKAYIPRAEVLLNVAIHNGGAARVELADPADPTNGELEYVVLGPGWSAERVFSQRALGGGVAGSTGEPWDRATIEPGATLSSHVPLDSFADLSALGEYHVRTRLTLPGGAVESGDCVLRVESLKPTVVHVATGLSEDRGLGEGVFIDHEALYTFETREGSPEIAEADVGAVIFRAPVGAAKDAAIPTRNTPFFDEMIRWVVWLDGATLSALTSAGQTPGSVTLPATQSGIVKPPLKTNGGPVEVLTLSVDRRTLQMVAFERIQAGDAVAELAGTMRWTATLPAEARAVAAALGPVGRGSGRHVAFAAHTPRGVEVFHSRYGAGGSLEPFESVRFEVDPAVTGVGPERIARCLEGASPALHVDVQGDAWASFIAVEGTSGLWIEARFPATGAQTKPGVTGVRLGDAIAAGAALYVADAASAIVRRELVVERVDKRLARWDGHALVPASPTGVPGRPMALVGGQDATYLLCIDEARGPHLEPL